MKGRRGGGYQLYNLKKDTHELNNLYDSEKEVAEFFKSKMNTILSLSHYSREKLEEEDEEALELLRSLGYIQ
ncbi:MAG: hypothetical protein KKD90_03705 [Candidatus Omnitrophica bacterium]|nr:hypothetical protein [Candidatus Omnitrophota bacterium]